MNDTAGLSFENSRGSCHVSRGQWVNGVRVMEGGTRTVNEGNSRCEFGVCIMNSGKQA